MWMTYEIKSYVTCCYYCLFLLFWHRSQMKFISFWTLKTFFNTICSWLQKAVFVRIWANYIIIWPLDMQCHLSHIESSQTMCHHVHVSVANGNEITCIDGAGNKGKNWIFLRCSWILTTLLGPCLLKLSIGWEKPLLKFDWIFFNRFIDFIS